jgi:hypothetical protein
MAGNRDSVTIMRNNPSPQETAARMGDTETGFHKTREQDRKGKSTVTDTNCVTFFYLINVIERRGRVVNTPATFSGGPEF